MATFGSNSTRRRPLRLLCALAVVAAVALTGCGDDDDDEAAQTTTTTSETGTEENGGVDADVEVVLTAQLTGAAEKPNPGDTDGNGSATVTVKATDRLACYEITVEGIEEPTKAHIHEGGADEAGPVFISFFEEEGGALQDCVEAETDQLARIVANPDGFYVNVHTASFPAGAVRGQLSR